MKNQREEKSNPTAQKRRPICDRLRGREQNEGAGEKEEGEWGRGGDHSKLRFQCNVPKSFAFFVRFLAPTRERKRREKRGREGSGDKREREITPNGNSDRQCNMPKPFASFV